MKRRLHSNNQDSLELLLDTLCNALAASSSSPACSPC
jgi:hypothetical protein